MTASGTAGVPAKDAPRGESVWLAVPSWLISLLFHAALLALLALSIRPPTTVGDPDADARQVGIYYKAQGETAPGSADDEAGASSAPQATTEGARDSLDDLRVEESPPVPLDLPAAAPARIGPGSAVPGQPAPRDARELVKSSGLPPTTGEKGGGGTTFFGQRATGARFVYLLDASGSMQEYNALGVAKAELLASLAQLDADQQFQIVFYSERSYPMLNSDGRSQYFAATDINRTLASQFVRGISPLEGTRHLEALLLALSFNPDVIFFLTDAGEPRLYPADLDRIRKRNGDKTQIHTIEFGKHANLNVETGFLRKLARENRGGYVYRDITQFRKDK